MAPHIHVRTRAVPLIALMAGSCSCCEPDATRPIVAVSCPEAFTAAALDPAQALAQPGQAVTFTARVWDQDGHPVAISAVEGVSVTWTAVSSEPSTPVALTPDGIHARVSAPGAPGEVKVSARVEGPGQEGSCFHGLSATGSGTLTVSPGTSDLPVSDRVLLANDQEARLLIRGRIATSGMDVEIGVSTVGTYDLGVDLTPRTDALSELTAFARDRAAFPRGVGPASPAWGDKADNVDADPMMDLGTSFRAIPVWVGLPPGDTLKPAQAKDHVDRAREILDAARAGIRLDYMGDYTHGLVYGTGTEVPSPSAACSTASVNKALGESTPHPQPPVDGGLANLHVLFVSAINEATPQRGHACTPESGWTGRVVLISTGLFNPTTLAHEIVHLLGFDQNRADVDDHHVEGLKGFDEWNLMHSSSPFAAERKHLTLGQLYRMNFDQASWLNEGILTGSGPARDCQSDLASGACPALATDPPPEALP